MCDAGGHLADRREALLEASVPLEAAQIGHVLKGKQIPHATIREGQRRDRQAQVDRPVVGHAVLAIETQAAGFGQGSETGAHVWRQLQHRHDIPADHGVSREPCDRRGCTIEGQDAAVFVSGRQAAQQAVDDVFVERAEVGHLIRRALEADAGRAKPFGEGPAEERDGKEPEEIDGDGVLRETGRGKI